MSFGHFGPKKARQVKTIQPVQNFNSTQLEHLDPAKHGAISQLINNRYLNEIKKDTKKVLMGRKLEEFLKRTFSVREFNELPKSAQNLIKFHRGMTAAEVLRFAEYWDNSHEIVFREYTSDNAKFKAMFEDFGKLYDVQMQAGLNNYVTVSKEFDIRKKVEMIFAKAAEKILFLKRPKKKATAKTRTRKAKKYSSSTITKIDQIELDSEA